MLSKLFGKNFTTCFVVLTETISNCSVSSTSYFIIFRNDSRVSVITAFILIFISIDNGQSIRNSDNWKEKHPYFSCTVANFIILIQRNVTFIFNFNFHRKFLVTFLPRLFPNRRFTEKPHVNFSRKTQFCVNKSSI